ARCLHKRRKSTSQITKSASTRFLTIEIAAQPSVRRLLPLGRRDGSRQFGKGIMRKILLVFGIIVGFTGLGTQASAATITYSTAPGATSGGNAVSASATFVTGAGGLTITLQDLLANP